MIGGVSGSSRRPSAVRIPCGTATGASGPFAMITGMVEHQFSSELIDWSGYRSAAFADSYDSFRPAPPQELLTLLAIVAQIRRPGLVVDLGAGTGLSTRAWAGRADEIVGVEPNPQMVEQARSATHEPSMRYLTAYADQTGLPVVRSTRRRARRRFIGWARRRCWPKQRGSCGPVACSPPMTTTFRRSSTPRWMTRSHSTFRRASGSDGMPARRRDPRSNTYSASATGGTFASRVNWCAMASIRPTPPA